MTARTSRSTSRIPTLTGTKGDYTFEVWVSVNGDKLPVLKASATEGGLSEGWIASREDESYYIHCVVRRNKSPARGADSKFLDMGAVIYVDGVQVGSTSVNTREGAAPTIFGGPCASGTEWRKLFFCKPEVTEDETPNMPGEALASIRVVFERGSFKGKNKVTKKDVAPGAEEYEMGPINEDMKKDHMVGAMTELGERTESAHVKAHSVGTYNVHPDDVAEGFYSMKLHYAPKELLQARGILNEPARNGAQKAGSASRQKRSAAEQPEAAKKRARKGQDLQEESDVKPAVD